jgi:ribosomal protein L40E
MSGYGLAEQKTARETKTNPHVCGVCGSRAPKHEELCQACKDDIFFTDGERLTWIIPK